MAASTNNAAKKAVRIVSVPVLCALLALAGARFATALFELGADDPVATLLLDAPSVFFAAVAEPFAIGWDDARVVLVAVAIFAIPILLACATLLKKPGLNIDTGAEHGDSRLATAREAGLFLDRAFEFNNFRYSENSGIAIVPHSKRLVRSSTGRNSNFVCLGTPGTGKTFNVSVPMCMEATGALYKPYPVGIKAAASNVAARVLGKKGLPLFRPEAELARYRRRGIGEGFDLFATDPKGDTLADVGPMLEAAGFDIRVMNTLVPRLSCRVNPIAYIPVRYTDVCDLSDVPLKISLEAACGRAGRMAYSKAVPLALGEDSEALRASIFAGRARLSCATSFERVCDEIDLDEISSSTTDALKTEIEALRAADPNDPRIDVLEEELLRPTDAQAGEECDPVRRAVREFSYRRTKGALAVKLANESGEELPFTLKVASDRRLRLSNARSLGAERVEFSADGGVVVSGKLPPASEEGEPCCIVEIPCAVESMHVPDGVMLTKIADTLVRNLGGAQGPDEPSGDMKFWDDCKQLTFMALIALTFERYAPEHRTIPAMRRLLNLFVSPELGEDPTKDSPLRLLMDQWETGMELEVGESPDGSRLRSAVKKSRYVPAPTPPHDRSRSLALHCYHAVADSAKDTLLSVVISCHTALASLLAEDVEEMLSYDELHLEELGEADSKTAIFCIVDDSPSPYNFITALVMQLAVDLARERAFAKHSGRLPRHVRYLLDEAGTIGKVPVLKQAMAVVRSRNMSIGVFFQSKAQIAENYGDKGVEVILDSASTLMFLGGQSPDTLQMISERIGNETVYSRIVTRSWNQGPFASGSSEYIQGNERAVRSKNQLAGIPTDTMLVFIGGLRYAIWDRKIDTRHHPLYRYVCPTSPRTLSQPPAAFDRRFDYREYRERKKRSRRTEEVGRA